MIGRLWRGWTEPANADAYVRFLRDDLFPQMESIRGFRGGYVMRRPEGDEVAFVTLTLFDSLDDVKRFAGDGYETPVIEPQAARLLKRYEPRAEHYDAPVTP
jgi:hypothetical protein